MERIKYVIETLQPDGTWIPGLEYYNEYEAQDALKEAKSFSVDPGNTTELVTPPSDLEGGDYKIDYRIKEIAEHYMILATSNDGDEKVVFNELMLLYSWINSRNSVNLKKIKVYGLENDDEVINKKVKTIIVATYTRKRHWWSNYRAFNFTRGYISTSDFLENAKIYKGTFKVDSEVVGIAQLLPSSETEKDIVG